MLRPAMNDLLSNSRDSYSFVVSVAKRARDIAIKSEEQNIVLEEKPVQLAVMEFASNPWPIPSGIKER